MKFSLTAVIYHNVVGGTLC